MPFQVFLTHPKSILILPHFLCGTSSSLCGLHVALPLNWIPFNFAFPSLLLLIYSSFFYFPHSFSVTPVSPLKSLFIQKVYKFLWLITRIVFPVLTIQWNLHLRFWSACYQFCTQNKNFCFFFNTPVLSPVESLNL